MDLWIEIEFKPAFQADPLARARQIKLFFAIFCPLVRPARYGALAGALRSPALCF
jgi:hypothetical protein